MNRELSKHWLRSSALLGVVFALSGACGTAADGGHTGSDPNGGVAQSTQAVVITASTIEKLAPGDHLTVDLRLPTIYTFDYAKSPIDWTRIWLISERGQTMTMDKWMPGFSDTVRDNYGVTLPTAQIRLFGKGTHATNPATNGAPSNEVEYTIIYSSDDGNFVLVCEYDDYTNELIYCDVY